MMEDWKVGSTGVVRSMRWKRLIFICCLYHGATTSQPVESSSIEDVPYYMTVQIPDEPYQITMSKIKTIRNLNAHLATVHVGRQSQSFSSDKFRILVDGGPSCSLRKTSSFAKRASCDYALNGGPFLSYLRGGCIGLTISNGDIIHGYVYGATNTEFEKVDADVNMGVEVNAAFGLTYDDEWIIGNVAQYNHGDYSNIKELITGLDGWLVKNSTIVPSKGDHGRLAPRSAIGINNDGSLVLLQVDGCEHCLSPSGLSMYEMATLMSRYAEHGINLDGGGSSTSVGRDGQVLNHPTCLDYIKIKCERPVASAVCIGSRQIHHDVENGIME